MNETLIVDIGGTKTNLAFLTSSNNDIKILSSHIFPTNSKPASQIEEISNHVSKMGYKTQSLSLSLPGVWSSNGVLLESNNLKNWLGYEFINNLKQALNIKDCIWETDVICGALGEYHYGAGTGQDQSPGNSLDNSLLYLNLGTGIGAALINNGKPFKSKSHLTLRMQKLLLPIEDELTSATDLLSGNGLLKSTKYSSIEELYNLYKKGEPETYEIILKSQLQLSCWIINLFYLFAPEVIVLNGGLTYDWTVLCEEAIDIANEELNNQVKIVPGSLKEQAPIYGAYVNSTNTICHSER